MGVGAWCWPSSSRQIERRGASLNFLRPASPETAKIAEEVR